MVRKRVTIKEVAKRAGVSISTVSRVLNSRDNKYIREVTRNKVMQAVKELNYKPDRRAQSLRGVATKIIGLIIPNRLNPYFEQVAQAIEEVCFDEGYGILLCSSNNNQKRESIYLDLLEKQKVDGIVISTVGLTRERFNELISRGIPVVLIDEDVPGVNAPAVFANNYMGGCQATQYLIQLGHERIAFISGPIDLLSSRERYRGYRDTLAKEGIKVGKELFKEGSFTYESGYRATWELLDERNKFTAIFCSNDLMAFGAMRAIQDKGKKVPRDYSIVGFDDMYFSSISNPQLTTVAQPVKEMAFRAFIALKEQIAEGFSHEKSHQFLDTKLIVRESCRSLDKTK